MQENCGIAHFCVQKNEEYFSPKSQEGKSILDSQGLKPLRLQDVAVTMHA